MKRAFLALAIHNHQPVGNFDFVFADAYAKAYLPMIDLLERHPAVKLALHYTGPLRDWIVAQHPELFARIRGLVARGQVEIMTGGYYEPILVAIPDVDKRGQIQKLTRAVKKDFGYAACGLWLAERVWEPHLAKPLAEAGVEYTIVDDTHFKYVGLDDPDLLGYYVTEEQGATLKIFGTSKHLRYTIPWASVDEVIDWLREQATDDGARVAVMGDDGEKFGLWPGTHEHCWGTATRQGWMEQLFAALEKNQEWLQTITLAEYQRQFSAIGRVYLPTASYDEMTEWALPAKLSGDITRLKHRLQEEKRDDILRFVKGAFWRNFIVKYPEVNTLHKKMLLVSEKVNRLQGRGGAEEERSRSPWHPRTPARLLSDALSHLYAGQCNCPYWHGVFGGIYLPHIRTANFAHLIAAETLADQITRGKRAWVDVEKRDLDKDSMDELLVSGSAMNLYFDLARGGALFEWDWRAKKLNLLNTLSRREEGYHRDLVEAVEQGAVQLPGEKKDGTLETIHTTVVRAKEPGLEKLLNYDWYRRVGLIDHFIHPDSSLDHFARAQHRELGDFVNQPYNPRVTKTKKGLVVILARDGHIWQDDVFAPLRVEKRLRVERGAHTLPIAYTLTNTGTHGIAARFGVEFCLALLAGHSDGAYYRFDGHTLDDTHLDSRGEVVSVSHLALVNEWLGVEVALSLPQAPARVWRVPIETISLSEAGFERVYQAACIVPLWTIRLPPGEQWHAEFEFELR
jgi:alpha-amylase